MHTDLLTDFYYISFKYFVKQSLFKWRWINYEKFNLEFRINNYTRDICVQWFDRVRSTEENIASFHCTYFPNYKASSLVKMFNKTRKWGREQNKKKERGKEKLKFEELQDYSTFSSLMLIIFPETSIWDVRPRLAHSFKNCSITFENNV